MPNALFSFGLGKFAFVFCTFRFEGCFEHFIAVGIAFVACAIAIEIAFALAFTHR